MRAHECIDQLTRHYELAQKATSLYEQQWGLTGVCSEYMWFECLAKTVNLHMSELQSQAELQGIFKLVERGYVLGGMQLKDCVDTGFVENLFWEVCQQHSRRVWPWVPATLQTLYVQFHGKKPFDA